MVPWADAREKREGRKERERGGRAMQGIRPVAVVGGTTLSIFLCRHGDNQPPTLAAYRLWQEVGKKQLEGS